MLPPQAHGLSAVRRHSVSLPLRQASVPNAVRVGTSISQCRDFANWRHITDYASHIDPLYRRFTRFRTLKTRAKLIEKAKRYGKFEWDGSQKPYFNYRNLRLYASIHGRDPRWRYTEDPKKQGPDGREGEHGEDGYELSAKEKEWKEKMEHMRKRLEMDPYEAVFGKRFEPFWSALVPSWMREEMGSSALKPAERETRKHDAAGAKSKPENTGIDSLTRDLRERLIQVSNGGGKETPTDASKASKPTSKGASDLSRRRSIDAGPPRDPSSLKTELQKRTPQESQANAEPPPATPSKHSNYAEYTSTSWDSWTNKARRTEWDSQSGQTKRFEYDPVSNRMVQVAGPQPAETAGSKQVAEPIKTDIGMPLTKAVAKRADDMRSLINTPGTLPKDGRALDVPVKTFTSEDKASLHKLRAESIKTRDWANAQSQSTVTLNTPTRSHGTTIPAPSTSNHENRSVNPATSVKPAALSKLPANDMDLLTADDVRAKMGKVKQIITPKPTTAGEKAAMETAFQSRSMELDSELDTILKDRELAKAKKQPFSDAEERKILELRNTGSFERELDTLRRKKAKLLNDEHGLFHIERQKRELAKLDHAIKDAETRLQHTSTEKGPWDFSSLKGELKQYRAFRFNRFDALSSEGEGPRPAVQRLETSLDRTKTDVEKVVPGTPGALQPAVERMQSKELPRLNDLDDAAAHESTEAIVEVSAASNVPENWSEAADVLQADRVKRTAGKRPYPMTRWIDDMNARKAAHEASKAPSPAEEAAAKEKAAQLQKANEMLESEVKEQKFRMQAHENRYAHKIRSLRSELDTAFKQSAVHSEKHVERIRFLEKELAKANKAAGDDFGSLAPNRSVLESKTAALKELQGEGDFCPNITKFASSEKWYKQPTATSTLSKEESQKAEQKARDQALVKQVRDIYEREYGVIDTNHRQRVFSGSEARISSDKGPKKQLKPKQVVEVESDVDLGDALAEHEKTQNTYAFKADGLEKELKAREKLNREAEIAAHEKEAHEAQALMQPESAQKMEKVIAEGLKSDMRSSTKLQDIVSAIKDRRSASSTAEAAVAPSAPESRKVEHGVSWEEPPVYKVLAYDSGNDIITAVTTTANFTGSETPISIPQALSQLYQPARFVTHFAELQEDGWQVIYGTRDLLVFRKVKAANAKTAAPVEPVAGDASFGIEDHGLHTLVRPMENAMAQEAAEYYGKFKPEPKVYDPTSIENGKLMPYENAMAQEAAHAYDRARAMVNPIDGTTQAATAPEVSTGNFASPTGFVNHDPVFPEEKPETIQGSESESSKQAKKQEDNVELKHYPRVRRQEPHFSGGRMRKHNDRHERYHRRWEESRRERKRGGALKWALTVGVGAAGLTYVVGVAAEMARQDRHEKERWQEILERKRSRWE